MFTNVDIWKLIGSAFGALIAIAALLRAIVSYKSHRLTYRRSQVDTLWKLSEVDVENMSPEQSLAVAATLSHAYQTVISLEVYLVLRRAKELAWA